MRGGLHPYVSCKCRQVVLCLVAQNVLTRQVLIAAATACMAALLNGSYRPAYAETESVVIDMPVYGQIRYGDLIRQAESLAHDAIGAQFSQNPEISTLQVVVTGDHHGEIIPILTATVSRAQWQENSQVSDWSRYYSSSYALLQRHDQDETVAIAPGRPIPPPASSLSRSALIDQAFDSGRLTGPAAQEYLNELD